MIVSGSDYREQVSDKIAFATDIGPRILDFFERLFNVPFPLPKMDMAAIQGPMFDF
jgi:aminopeptidase N